MQRDNIVEIKKGQCGTGLLIEQDGYVSVDCGNNRRLFEEIGNNRAEGEFFCPKPFVVDAVFQKYGIENANGRIYPEDVLKREVSKYQVKIEERRAIGECYRPEAMILTEVGWKHLYEDKEGENILTLNPDTDEIEIKPIERVVRYHYEGPMINIRNRFINDVVTPTHGFPIYDRNNKFGKFITAQEIHDSSTYSHFYIPKTGKWVGEKDEFIVIPRLTDEELSRQKNSRRKEYSEDLRVSMGAFVRFMAMYLSGGFRSSEDSSAYKVCIRQKRMDICAEIENVLDEWGVRYKVNESRGGMRTFTINDARLWKYVGQFVCEDGRYVPSVIKKQSKETLRVFYDWFVMGSGRTPIKVQRKMESVDCAVSESRQLALDLNEIQMKLGYSGELREDESLYFTYREFSKGVYMDKRFIETSVVEYDGDVMCVEVPNHIWYVMDDGKCHWTKNCNHPSESTIDLSRVAINITELHWEGHTLVGKMEILISEGFRRFGIISCQGDQIAHLLLSGIKIGVSSRGLGTVTKKLGHLYVSDDYEIVCWDVVSDPSTPNAWIAPEGKIPDSYKNDGETGEERDEPEIFNKLDRFSSWLNGN